MASWPILAALGVGALAVAQRLGGPARGVRDLAASIALAEGFGVPGALPTVRHNPGDLIFDAAAGPATYATDAEGWAALYRMLELIAGGGPAAAPYRLDMTIAEFGNVYTGTERFAWSGNVIAGLQARGYDVTRESSIGDVLAAGRRRA